MFLLIVSFASDIIVYYYYEDTKDGGFGDVS